MKGKLLLLLLIIVFIANRFMSQTTHNTEEAKTKENLRATEVIRMAKLFNGTPYKFGGTTKNGMDCSGLVFTAFKKIDIQLPRSSRSMSSAGKEVSLQEVALGDLLFFKTSSKQDRINHVGLVTSIENSNVQFIHATTTKGVITTSINQPYWKEAFVKAKRVL